MSHCLNLVTSVFARIYCFSLIFFMSFCSKQLWQNSQNAISGMVFDYEHRKISICTLYLGNQFKMQSTKEKIQFF